MHEAAESSLVADFQELENRRVGYLLGEDFDAVELMLADSLIYGHSTGLVDDKRSLMASLRARTVRYLSISSKLTAALPLEENIVLTSGVIAIKARVNGEEGIFGGRFMAIWKNGSDGWLLQALQATNAGREEG
jgi:hypothetical protein